MKSAADANLWNDVDAYIENLFIVNDDLLTATLADSGAGRTSVEPLSHQEGKR
jgi:hypothetical protein